MRVAALYDIHGNLPALEAVLEDVRRCGANGVIVGGDVFPGPMAREALGCLRAAGLPVSFVSGNCETALLAERAGTPIGGLPQSAVEAIRWSAEQLSPTEEAFVRGWPGTLRVDIDGIGGVLFCHATPRDNNEIFTCTTPEERLVPIFDLADAGIVVCGHTHMQFDRVVGRTRVINAGSVGMPFGEPGAYWLVLARGSIELKRTEYDLAGAADRIRRTSYPQANDFAEHSVLHPPSEAQMIEVFSRAERK